MTAAGIWLRILLKTPFSKGRRMKNQDVISETATCMPGRHLPAPTPPFAAFAAIYNARRRGSHANIVDTTTA